MRKLSATVLSQQLALRPLRRSDHALADHRVGLEFFLNSSQAYCTPLSDRVAGAMKIQIL
jgi:hypothetical protein